MKINLTHADIQVILNALRDASAATLARVADVPEYDTVHKLARSRAGVYTETARRVEVAACQLEG